VKGKFKLADPGFAVFEKSEAFKKLEKRDQTTMFRGGTRTYGEWIRPPSLRFSFSSRMPLTINLKGAPECEPGRTKHALVPRSIDIWSLGCVFSVAASWMVLGAEGLYQFTRIRQIAVSNLLVQNEAPIGDYFHDGTNVLPEVLQWHEYLRNHCRRSDPITSEVLHFVDQKMLRARGDERLDATELCNELVLILAKCQSSGHFTLPDALRNALIRIDNDSAQERPSARSEVFSAPSEVFPARSEVFSPRSEDFSDEIQAYFALRRSQSTDTMSTTSIPAPPYVLAIETISRDPQYSG
jgi:hypothetical protein